MFCEWWFTVGARRRVGGWSLSEGGDRVKVEGGNGGGCDGEMGDGEVCGGVVI